ncbi:zinc ABC transporter substrate-binding protein [Cognatiyoonia sp. IB215182]|uniref:zinc ABC transporter substrate-binding protein n=1 Tax=Cognatiyoonia sp. IB215182 TaxID=3097353 RepID=UPI002A15E0F9|nr:zinc ABC transporter substrate-binding protein [Cognatiyoonia sp. IB215182]MDX8352559.1 zinc ABC transporter substrate-binding protein [Cognatiyoonia sp. IB215182]
MSRKLLPLSVTAILMGGTAMADVPNVAVDIAPVHSLVARVMEGVGTPDLIVQPGASPHEYSLRPSEAAALQNADLVFWIGEDLTPWMENAVETLAEGAAVTTLLETGGTTLLDFREDALFEAHDHGHDEHEDHDAAKEASDHDHDHDDHDHEEQADADGHDHDDHDHEEHAEAEAHDHDHDHEEHAEAEAHDHDHDHEEHAEADAHDHDHDDHGHDDHAGHDHGEHDPHAWLSPTNASTWLNVIAAQLSAADPDNAGAYFANAAAARAEMEALSAEINATLDPARGGSFIVFHDAYQYFEANFDFPASGAISIGDATDPSPARIAEIQGRIRDEGVDCVLAEPQFNPGLVATVLEGTEASIGVIDPLGAELEPGAALYPQLLRNMAATLAECL